MKRTVLNATISKIKIFSFFYLKLGICFLNLKKVVFDRKSFLNKGSLSKLIN